MSMTRDQALALVGVALDSKSFKFSLQCVLGQGNIPSSMADFDSTDPATLDRCEQLLRLLRDASDLLLHLIERQDRQGEIDFDAGDKPEPPPEYLHVEAEVEKDGKPAKVSLHLRRNANLIEGFTAGGSHPGHEPLFFALGPIALRDAAKEAGYELDDFTIPDSWISGERVGDQLPLDHYPESPYSKESCPESIPVSGSLNGEKTKLKIFHYPGNGFEICSEDGMSVYAAEFRLEDALGFDEEWLGIEPFDRPALWIDAEVVVVDLKDGSGESALEKHRLERRGGELILYSPKTIKQPEEGDKPPKPSFRGHSWNQLEKAVKKGGCALQTLYLTPPDGVDEPRDHEQDAAEWAQKQEEKAQKAKKSSKRKGA